MNILLGTHYLAKTGGTENYTYALAMELKRLGHDVEHFGIIRGRVSEMLREQGVPFMSRQSYDLILANHNTVVEKLWAYGYTIQTCHGTIAELEQPSPLADAYVGVSEEVREHLRGLGYQAAAIILNGIDCHRFCPRKPVSQELTTVLSLCQSDQANDFIGRCCERAGLTFLQSNKFTDNVWSVEDLINESDLVVGLGRSAYDAMACGRAVLVYDYRQYMGEFLGDGMLTPGNIEQSITCNCSGRQGRIHYDEQGFIDEMRRYTPELAAWGREYALQHLNIEQAAQAYLRLADRITPDAVNLQRRKHLRTEIETLKVTQDNLSDVLMETHKEENALRRQLDEHRAAASARSRRHLRAIRALLWLCIALMLALAALLCHMLL